MYFNEYKTGLRIRNLREHMGITQEEFANTLGISLSHISRIECGRRTPSIDLLLSISEYFGVSLDYLIAGYDNRADLKSSLLKISESIIEIAFNL